METDIFKTLRELKRIHPDSDYAKHSRMLILASPQQSPAHADTLHVSTFFRLSTIIGLGLIGIFMILGGTTYINETYSPLALEGLNHRSLIAEADEINDSIEVTLATIDYLDTSNQTTLTKIAEISKSESPAVSAATMMLAAPASEPSATTTADIDAFLIKSDPSEISTERQIDDILDEVSR
ncbi:hypothetical protein A2333_00065 [Candidatus Wolfebacteria bacterium RIFOXYB2_FULL_49_7]|uniref:Uncharacterized protein n=1 Tax=Candidatus Wolfebacteria bacterium RIFOXYB1_FULL_54_12 TaxID=1802559 RepID=A0A1F8DY88_9BACT|nr:MAG: hypothetical protein A2372_01030 [Candidatus Wolfebacteria bacterium RIFOXYB1_FULL_54_12]OGM96765.1 MAG: hypothetical protein A2333_00065 [Candidatus Wolfebacteria bacterium RIFOXYB2_FULL_49_7]